MSDIPEKNQNISTNNNKITDPEVIKSLSVMRPEPKTKPPVSRDTNNNQSNTTSEPKNDN